MMLDYEPKFSNRPETIPGWYRRHETRRVRKQRPNHNCHWVWTGATIEILHKTRLGGKWYQSRIYTLVPTDRRASREASWAIRG